MWLVLPNLCMPVSGCGPRVGCLCLLSSCPVDEPTGKVGFQRVRGVRRRAVRRWTRVCGPGGRWAFGRLRRRTSVDCRRRWSRCWGSSTASGGPVAPVSTLSPHGVCPQPYPQAFTGRLKPAPALGSIVSCLSIPRLAPTSAPRLAPTSALRRGSTSAPRCVPCAIGPI